MMMAFVHKEIMDSNQFKSMVKPDELHEQIGAGIFFHDRIIERWIKITDFDVVSKEMNKFSREEKEMALKDLSTYTENIFIIYNNESTSDGDMFNIYVYDGNFLRLSFEIQLEELSNKLLPTVYAIRTSKSIDFDKICCHCHARSILVRKTQSYTTIIDRLYDASKKFEYLSTAGGMAINREITRMSENAKRKKTYKDDAYSAFSFFMALYSQILSSA